MDTIVITEHCIAKYLVSSYMFQNPKAFFWFHFSRQSILLEVIFLQRKRARGRAINFSEKTRALHWVSGFDHELHDAKPCPKLNYLIVDNKIKVAPCSGYAGVDWVRWLIWGPEERNGF